MTNTQPQTISPEIEALLAQGDRIITEAETFLQQQGRTYSLAEWITPAEYARRFGLASTMIVTNRISRGVIPAENVLHVPEINNTRLVKAIPYHG